MPYGTLALDAISTSGNLAVTGNVSALGNLTVTGNTIVSGNLTVSTIKSTTSSPPTIRNSSDAEVGTFCRAWVACNGSSTILAAFNVSSITDTGTGQITVNLATNAVPDANYAVAAINRYRASGGFETVVTTGAGTTSGFGLGVADVNSGAAVEVPYISAAVFR
jgi:hypothetical protein